MALFKVLVSSNVVNILNFLIFEIVVMAYVVYGTGIIAGALNYRCIKHGAKLRLKVLDFPHIGSGMVMNQSVARWALIFIRLSTLLAIAASNYGLEGQTEMVTKLGEATVRGPGPIEGLKMAKLFEATERRMRCAETKGDDIVFGAVINNKCYVGRSNDLYIQFLSLEFTSLKVTTKNCSRRENNKESYTVFKCEGVDIFCLIDHNARSAIHPGLCESVVYKKNESWICPVQSALPEKTVEDARCRRLGARQADISKWTEIYYKATGDLETAVFGAAYWREIRKTMDVPQGIKNITAVGLFWLIPTVYEILMVCIVTVWAIGLRSKGFKVVAQDEAGLARLLRRRVDLSSVRVAEWMRTEKGGGLGQWQMEDDLDDEME